MSNFFTKWLPIIILLLIPISLLLLHCLGYELFIYNTSELPAIVNTEIVTADTSDVACVHLLNDMRQQGVILSPQEYTNHVFNFFSWLLTILVAIIGIVIIFVGFNVDKKIESTLDSHLKKKWLELMKIDKEVDSTIGGIIDDKVEDAVLSYSQSIEKRLSAIEKTAITFEVKE